MRFGGAARRSVALALTGLLALGSPALAGAENPPAQPDGGVYIISTQSGATYVGSLCLTDDKTGMLVTLGNGDEVRLARSEIIQMIPESQANPPLPAPAVPPEAFAAVQTQVELHRAGVGAVPGSGMELRLERQNPRVKADSGWETACTEPCLGVVDNRYLYRITGNRVTTSSPFHIGSATSRLFVTSGDKRKYGAGLGLLIAGAVISGIDLSVGLRFLPSDPVPAPAALPIVAGVGVTGLGMLVVGVVLVKTQGTKVQVESGPELRQ